jgi:GDP-L-fucose synthase
MVTGAASGTGRNGRLAGTSTSAAARATSTPGAARAAHAVRAAPAWSNDLPLDARIYVAGHRGLVGSAVVRRLAAEGFTNVLTVDRAEVDLRDQVAVNTWFARHRPEYVFVVAGTVGGILANSTRPAEFIYDNMMIHATVVHAAYAHGAKKLLYLGSSCIYPRDCPQPIREDFLLTGPLEPTNAAYAIAKIAGIQLCQAYRRQYGCNFISAMPTNLYGPNDNFDLNSSHVLPALIRKFHDAKVARAGRATVWGTGRPRREFLHVDDLADCCLFLMNRYEGDQHINVGTGIDLSIGELAAMVGAIVYPEAELVFDPTKPDGTPRKLLDVGALHRLGWRHRIELEPGIASAYEWFLAHGAGAGTAAERAAPDKRATRPARRRTAGAAAEDAAS